MIFLLRGKTYNLVPHQKEPAWLLVPFSEVQDFQEMGIPLTYLEEGRVVLMKSDLWKRLSQGL